MTRVEAEKIAHDFFLFDLMGTGIHWAKKPRPRAKMVELLLRVTRAELDAMQTVIDERRAGSSPASPAGIRTIEAA